MSEKVSEEKAVRKGLSKIEFLLLFLPVLAFAVFSLTSPKFLIPLFFFSFLLVSAVWWSTKDELKKMLRKNVTITLGMACIILAIFIVLTGGVVGAFVMIRDKNNAISSLNSQLSNVQNDFSNFVNLNDSTVIASNQTISTTYGYFIWNFDADSSGYVSVTINNSTDNPTDVRYGYMNFGVECTNEFEIPINGTGTFPIMASPEHSCTVGVTIYFRNPTYAYNGATVTITYHY